LVSYTCIGFEATTTPFTLLLQEEEVSFELELSGRKYKEIYHLKDKIGHINYRQINSA